MKVSGKVTKTEIFILVLTAAFLGALGLASLRDAGPAGADYTVSVRYPADTPVTPEVRPPEPVDVNAAGEEELATLPGIGPALARRIIEYRAEHGPFRSVEELLEVKGIGEATLAGFRDRITLGTAEEAGQ